MSVMRLGYIHVRVTDIETAKRHYEDTLGLYPMGEVDGRIYYKGWDEFDHHSVVIEEGGVGMVKMGYKVRHADDLDVYEKRSQQFGCITERMSAGENHEVGDGVRVILPSGHMLELYHSMTEVGTEIGVLNPELFPRHLVGVGVPRVDHLTITAEDPRIVDRYFHEVLDFHPSEHVLASLDDGAPMIGSFMTTSSTPHDIAILGGPDAKLHHFAFELSDWSEIKRAGAIFSMDDVPVDVGPAQHGITRGETIYFFDPSGNRNEVFSGGYKSFPDRPTVTWTADQLAKGIFYINRELSDSFVTVVT